MQYLKLHLLILCLSFSFISYAQNQIVISSEYKKQAFVKLINEIEKEYSIRFFYEPKWLDSLSVKVSTQGQDLTMVLEKTLISENIYFFQDNNRIILTKGKRIVTELAEIVESNGHAIVSKNRKQSHKDAVKQKYLHVRKEQRINTIVVGKHEKAKNQKKIHLYGYIKDSQTGVGLIGATVYFDKPKTGTISDNSGYYSIFINKGVYKTTFSCVGMEPEITQLDVRSDGRIDIEMKQKLVALDEVVVKSEKHHNIRGTQIGIERIDIKTIKEIPIALGERDVLKATMMLPGVQSVGEGAAGINVRGSGTDQNLFLLNNIPVFNTSHLFGFFSTFNPDVIGDFQLYKSDIPVKYGSRVSSVVNISTKKGNKREFFGRAGISPVTAKVEIEGPLKKDTASYILALRSTYSDWILKELNDYDIRHSSAGFHDILGGFDYKFGHKSSLDVCAYYSYDKFKYSDRANYNYENIGASANWKYNFTQKLHMNISGIYSNYEYEKEDTQQPIQAYKLNYSINYLGLRSDFNYAVNEAHELDFGGEISKYTNNPGKYGPLHEESVYAPLTLQSETATESVIYLSDKFEITHRLSVSGGFRFTYFDYRSSRSNNTEEPSISENKKSISQSYPSLGYKFSGRFVTGPNSSIKGGYSRYKQHLLMLSNTVSISPTDTWKLCDDEIKPLEGEQYSLGFYRNFMKNNSIETSVEVYYKKLNNAIDFKEVSDTQLEDNIGEKIISGEGKAYGAELMVKKNAGKLTGWINYTYSKTMLKFPATETAPGINGGKYYPASYDKPHTLNLALNYRYSRRVSFSLNYTHSTGRPVTIPSAKIDLNGSPIIFYTDRNNMRLPDYIRLDASINIEGNLLFKKAGHSFWSLSVYNLLGRKNAYSIFFKEEDEVLKSYKMSIFGVPIVTLSYSFSLGNYLERNN